MDRNYSQPLDEIPEKRICTGRTPCAYPFFGILRPRLKAWDEDGERSSHLEDVSKCNDSCL